jgi:uncharacterized Zn finger protein (UPF0148 family)
LFVGRKFDVCRTAEFAVLFDPTAHLAGMSDFDKEAEREKLREQFEEEEADRQHTQQLSELLLKGATMTNNHCDRCGDPIFRYDGQAFCPTCHSEGQAGGNAQPARGNAQAETQGQRAATNAEGTNPAERSAAQSEGATAGADADEQAEQGSGSPTAGSQMSSAPNAGSARGRGGAGSPDEIPVETAPESGSAGDATDAEQALRATLTKFSRKAADTDDPGRAREDLAAAREAAEALDALPY